MASKAEIRRQLRQARLSLSDADLKLKNRAMVRRLKKLIDWEKVRTVHYFEPIRILLEADISELVTWLEDGYPRIQLFTPRLIEGEWEMISIKDKAPPKDFDLILVPMLGFDSKALHRIGYGGGYYDKFLATQPKARKIGVCYELGKLKTMPIESHDIPLDMVITEKATYITS